MKKLSRILIVVICVAVLLSLASCAGGFLSKAKVKSLVKEYGTPQAEVTFDYTYNNTKTKIVFVYDLLLDKTPVAVINFIQLAESGYFDDVVIDHYVLFLLLWENLPSTSIPNPRAAMRNLKTFLLLCITPKEQTITILLRGPLLWRCVPTR